MEWSIDQVVKIIQECILENGGIFGFVFIFLDIDYVEDWEKYGWEI